MAVGLPWTWGATPAEVEREYPCDAWLDGPVRSLTRAVSVTAPTEVLWRWLCQISVAPYSYDWIDNRGRRSPQELTPGADQLVLGQRMAVVFELVSVDVPHQWTGVTTPRGERMFGPVAMTYAAEPAPQNTSRLVGRLAVGGRGRLQQSRVGLLAWGDLLMMRRQFLNLKGLAERDAVAQSERPQ